MLNLDASLCYSSLAASLCYTSLASSLCYSSLAVASSSFLFFLAMSALLSTYRCPFCDELQPVVRMMAHNPHCYISFCMQNEMLPLCTCAHCNGWKSHPGDTAELYSLRSSTTTSSYRLHFLFNNSLLLWHSDMYFSLRLHSFLRSRLYTVWSRPSQIMEVVDGAILGRGSTSVSRYKVLHGLSPCSAISFNS